MAGVATTIDNVVQQMHTYVYSSLLNRQPSITSNTTFVSSPKELVLSLEVILDLVRNYWKDLNQELKDLISKLANVVGYADELTPSTILDAQTKQKLATTYMSMDLASKIHDQQDSMSEIISLVADIANEAMFQLEKENPQWIKDISEAYEEDKWLSKEEMNAWLADL